MANPLLFAIHQAERDNRTLKRLTAKNIGTAVNPNGAVLSAYRAARKNIRGLLEGRAPVRDVFSALQELERYLGSLIDSTVADSATNGQQSAVAQLAAYADSGVNALAAHSAINTAIMASSTRSVVNRQMAQAQALVANSASIGEIVGDGQRLGIIQPAPVQRDLANMAAQAATAAFSGWIWGQRPGEGGATAVFKRQAIAGIDERTTDCCLRVHGQVVGVNEPFTLVGTPHYADRVQSPPFHDYCRTSTALYVEQFDDGLTEKMQEAARLELELREKPGYKPPHPVNAFTRVAR